MFSVIICTYNPDLRLIRRALASIVKQNTSLKYEVIIVNNNSSNGFDKDNFLLSLAASIPEYRIISEPKQGLVYARLQGVRQAKYETIVFVDDDNELESDYLEKLNSVKSEYPTVKVWGAGTIVPEFVDAAPDWVRTYMLDFYQNRSIKQTTFGRDKLWKDYFPVGSGMSVEKQVFNEYAKVYYEGGATAVGRKGDSLSSGEDAQIIWVAIKNGRDVGSSPLLRLTHLIPLKRTKRSYLEKLNYNLSVSHYMVFKEVFGKEMVSYGKIKLRNFIALFFSVLIQCKGNIVSACRVYNVRKMWYIGFNDYLKQLK